MRALLCGALAAATLALTCAGTAVAEAPPSPRLVELTDEEAKVAATLLSCACKASPGESLEACDAASALRRKIADAPRAPVKSSPSDAGAGADKDKFPVPER